MCRHTDDPEVIATTSGRAIPDVEVRIVDPDGEETHGANWARSSSGATT